MSEHTAVEIASRRFTVPLDCPCCGATPDTEIVVAIARSSHDRAHAESARGIDFPYCRHCVDHVGRWESAGVMSAGLIVIGLVAGAAVAAVSSVAIGVTAAAAGIVFAAVIATSRRAQARRAMRESCSSPGRAIAYLGWSGSASGFRFESISYAAKFAEQNSEKLVEDPAIRKLLERYKLARIAVPTPATAVAIPPPLDVADWIAKIAQTPGRVARRGAFARALEAFRETRERDLVVRAVAAIELAALLAPLEQLGTADKRRHLRTTIEQVRYDNIPDELQQEMLRDLEDRLSRL